MTAAVVDLAEVSALLRRAADTLAQVAAQQAATPPPSNDDADLALLTDRQVADMTSIPPSTLRYWRGRDEGPRFINLGRSVRYRRADVVAWINAQYDAGTES